jgi:hypothetical protein
MAMHVKLARGKSVGVLEPAFINTRPEYREWRDLAPSLYNSTLKTFIKSVRACVRRWMHQHTHMHDKPRLTRKLKIQTKNRGSYALSDLT